MLSTQCLAHYEGLALCVMNTSGCVYIGIDIDKWLDIHVHIAYYMDSHFIALLTPSFAKAELDRTIFLKAHFYTEKYAEPCFSTASYYTFMLRY